MLRALAHDGVGRWLTGVLLVAIAACSEPRPARPAIVADAPGSVSTWGFTPSPDEVILIGTAPLRVLRPVVLDSAALDPVSGGFTLLEARVSLFACKECRKRPGFLGYPGYAGSGCSTGPWPPPGYGPSYPLNGFEVAPGDRPSILLYLRAQSASAKSNGFTITYREDDEPGTSTITNERVEIVPSPEPDTCSDSLWFGGTNNPDADLVRPL